MKKSIVSVVLALVLALSVCMGVAGAESAIDLRDMSCTVGGVTCNFPVPVSTLKEAGLNVPDVSALEEGKYYPNVQVDDGKTSFSIRVEYCTETPDEKWATGCTLRASENPGVVVGGLVLGETTCSDVVAALGSDSSSKTSGDTLTYYLDDMTCNWTLYFDEDGKLKSVSMHSDLVGKYGDIRTINFAEPSADLPDAASMTYDEFILCGHHYKAGDTVAALLNNGWKIGDSEAEIEARSGNRVSGDRSYYYNGEALVKVGSFNLEEEAQALKDSVIDELEVTADMGGELILTGDIRIGSTLEAAKAAFGEASSSKEEEGVTISTFSVLNNTIHYTVTTDAQGTITALAIDGLMNR